jgi:hypothetical protein
MKDLGELEEVKSFTLLKKVRRQYSSLPWQILF